MAEETAVAPVDSNDPFAKLYTLLGFNPKRDVGPKGADGSPTLFSEALNVVVAKRLAAAKEKAVVLVEQAIDLKSKWDAEENRFNAQKKKFMKEFGKVMGGIERLARGETTGPIDTQEHGGEVEEKKD